MNLGQGPIRRGAVALALLAATGCAGAAARRASPAPPQAGPPPDPPDTERRAYTVPGHGAIELPVPRGWTVEVAGAERGPLTLRVERPGAGFLALLTPFWNPGEPEGAQDRADTARLFAELARRNARGGAVEEDVPLEPLVGWGVSGYWFAATDRALVGREPGPDEWRHVLQGAAAVGSLVLAFTLLDNADGPQREAVLAMVRAARHVDGPEARSGAERAAQGLEPDPGARTVPLRVEVAGKAWAVLVDLPGFRMFKPRRSDDGAGVLVLGEDPRSGIIASVILRPGREAHDAGACRDADLPRIRDAAPELAQLALASPAGGAAAGAWYVLAAPGGAAARQHHGHAWVERDGICANVHVSKVDPGPDDRAAMERILASVRFGEEL